VDPLGDAVDLRGEDVDLSGEAESGGSS
jgi:hypothetical protein